MKQIKRINPCLFLPLTLLLLSSSLNNDGQSKTSYTFSHVANYRLTFQKDSTDKNSVSTDYWRLYIGDESSLFTSVKYLAMDSIKRVEAEKGNPYGPPMSWYMSHGTKNALVVFKDYQKGVTTCHDKLAPIISEHYAYVDENAMNWELLDDTTTIGGLSCFAATTNFGGRKWTAWYAPEIALPDGPYKFKGLPGLVLHVEDSTKTWKYELVDFKEEEQSLQFNCSDRKHIKVTKQEYCKRKRNFYDNQIDIMKTMGYTFSDERKAKKLHARDNNWIELYP